jgi:peroxiredoxin
MRVLARRKGQLIPSLVLSAVAILVGYSTGVPRAYAATELAEASTLVGKSAPDFTLTDSNGKARSLHDYKGKIVVLEWFNHGCPFVKKHYDSGNMPKLQKDYTAKGVIWLSICSSAPGKQGYGSGSEQNAVFREKDAAPTAILSDADGKVGHLYGARSTPSMYVIDKKGKLVYAGAIDDKPTTDLGDVAGAQNYVKAALDEVLEGKPVAVASTRSYGCSVKYSDQPKLSSQ